MLDNRQCFYHVTPVSYINCIIKLIQSWSYICLEILNCIGSYKLDRLVKSVRFNLYIKYDNRKETPSIFELNKQECRALLPRIIIINTIIDTSLVHSLHIHIPLLYAKCMQNCILTLDFWTSQVTSTDQPACSSLAGCSKSHPAPFQA